MDHDPGNVPPAAEQDELILRLLKGMRRVAVVGISGKEERASHRIARFLAQKDLEVLGVNPALESFPGVKMFPSLADIPEPVDVVDVFRRSDAVPEIVDAAIAHGAGAVWLQEGVSHPEAEARAREAGLDVVSDLCIYKEWQRLLNP